MNAEALSIRGTCWRLFAFVILFSVFGCKAKHPVVSRSMAPHNEISLRSFGAIPDDGIDDSKAIQHAIDNALSTGRGTILKFEPGVYKIEKGIVLGHLLSGGEFSFINLVLSGHKPAFSANPGFGANTVFESTDNGFTIALQKARNCVIENIVFVGNGLQLQSASDIMNSTSSDWFIQKRKRVNRYSPHCAIAIDPFSNETNMIDQYPGFEEYYESTSTGGSSMIQIRGCTFLSYYIGIANNPSVNIQNGENIHVDNSYVESCHIFWACGQTQSRNNHIRDVYALFLHTFINGIEIGKQQGTPPFVTGVNIAGFCKYVFNVQTQFSGLWVKQSYMESIWSLGFALVNTVSFDDCQIQFRLPDADLFAPPFHLYSHAPVHFSNCGIEFFNNCQTPAPVMMRSGSLHINGGWIEGGVIVANGITNEGGDEAHNVVFESVLLKCLGKITGKPRYQQPIENLSQEIFIGGTKLESLDGSSFSSTGSTYHFIKLDSVTITVDAGAKTATFSTMQSGLIKENDNLFLTHTFTPDPERHLDYTIRPSLGFVKRKNQQQIEVHNIPQGLVSGKYLLCILDYPVFIPPLWGVTQAGGSQIQQVQAYSASFYPKPGTRISNSGFPEGAYVVSADQVNHTIQMSVPAIVSSASQLIKGMDYEQTIVLQKWTPDQIPVIIEGANIFLRAPLPNGFQFVNSTKAIRYTSFKPKLNPGN